MFPLSALAGFGSVGRSLGLGGMGPFGAQPIQLPDGRMAYPGGGDAMAAWQAAQHANQPGNWGPAIQGIGAAGQQLLQGGTGALPQAPQAMDPNAPPPDPAAVAQLQQQQGQVGWGGGGIMSHGQGGIDPYVRWQFMGGPKPTGPLGGDLGGFGGGGWNPYGQQMMPLSALGWPGAYGGGLFGGRRFWF